MSLVPGVVSFQTNDFQYGPEPSLKSILGLTTTVPVRPEFRGAIPNGSPYGNDVSGMSVSSVSAVLQAEPFQLEKSSRSLSSS